MVDAERDGVSGMLPGNARRRLLGGLAVNVRLVLVALTGFSIACGCSSSQNTSSTATSVASTSPMVTSAPGGAMPGALADGKLIFQTGKDVNGVAIKARKPPLRPRCAACHRADGSGGMKLPGGVTSADLRYKALVTNQKRPYTQALLERAISSGIDNVGKPLDPVMPRWVLSKRDLHDVATYVRTQLK